MLQPSPQPRAGSSGETPAACALAIASGTSIVAAAVFDVTSVKKIAKTEKTIVSPATVETPVAPTSPFPSASERPVRNIAH